jgi:hypothetical protein
MKEYDSKKVKMEMCYYSKINYNELYDTAE